MASTLGSIFSSLGESLPRMSKAFTDEEERRREREIALERLAQLRATSEDQNYEREQRNLGDQRYNEYSSDMSALSELGGTPESVLSQMDAGPLPAQQQGKVQKLYRLSQQKPMEQMQSYDLPKLAGFNKGIGSAIDTELAMERMNASSGSTGGGSSVYGMKKKEWNENPEKAKGVFMGKVETLLGLGRITPEEAEVWKKDVDVRPIDASIALDQLLVKPSVSAANVAAQTPAKVEQKYALIAPEAAGAVAEQTAKTNAPRRMDKGELESLRTKRSIYDDLTSAQAKFKPEYAKAYFGKLVKISFLKQNVPGFSDFISDLERGVGKYRKDQFGASQTEGEASNLKDAINKDLDVDPKVFITQMNNFVQSLERDYSDEVEVYKSDNVKVPDIFNGIRTTKTVNPNRPNPPPVNTPVESSGIKQIKTDADYDNLPSGTEFIDPTGKRRRKP
jgi:hypothetical protein